jgi:6-phosphogluconolactonase
VAVVTVVAEGDAFVGTAAGRIASLVQDAITTRSSAVVCLTGGDTPGPVYERLADPRSHLGWPRVHLFWGDERHVPPDHPESNFGLARRTLLDRVPVPDSHVHRIRGEIKDANEAAVAYDQEMGIGFSQAGRRSRTFDLVLLGLGQDAHIASIFPGTTFPTPTDSDEGPRVAAVWVEHLNAWRITLTPLALLDARAIVVMVAGAKKAGAVRAALELPLDVKRWPAQVLRAAGDRVEWILDRGAASQVQSSKFGSKAKSATGGG